MSERYSRIFTYRQNTYSEGSPVIIAAGALLLDNNNGRVIAQLKFQSISDKTIKALSVEIEQLDTAGRVLGEKIRHQYLDLNIAIDEIFGSKVAIAMNDNTTRAFKVTVDEVIFKDNSVWKANGSSWDELSTPKKVIREHELLKEFKSKYGIEYKNHLLKQKDLWFCFCGAINKDSKCHKCGSDISKFEDFNFEILESECEERLEKEKKEKEQQEEALRLNAEKRAKRKKKIAIITTPIVCAIIAFIIVLNTVIIPNGKYNDAVALMDSDVVKAYEALTSLNDYKDSTEIANTIYEDYKIAKLKVANVGDYVYFGSYLPSNCVSDEKTKIEWLVLAKEENKVLVISKFALESLPYHTTFPENGTTWESCSLRKWLNNEFINTAFSADEKIMIPTVTVSADKNPEYSTNPGNATQDQIFLLSITEVKRYFTSNESRKCGEWWWLRTPGKWNDSAASVDFDGSINCFGNGEYVCDENGTVRPAMWIEFSAVK